jgi:hypothetical protein
MEAACNLALVFHGAVVLLLSQVAGYAFFRAIHGADATKTGMWRMSHAACSAGAVLLFALAPIVPHLRLAAPLRALLVGALVLSTYALCLGTVIAGASGQRGIRPKMPWPNVTVYALYVFGAVGSTLAALVLLYAAGCLYLE